MGIMNKVNDILLRGRSGSCNNIALQRRVAQYKRKEKALESQFGGRDPFGNPEYLDAAANVAQEWVELVTDLAVFLGEPMERSEVNNIRSLLDDSILESVEGSAAAL